MFPTGEHKKTAGLLIPAVLYHSLFRTYNILCKYNTLWGEACQIKIVFEHTLNAWIALHEFFGVLLEICRAKTAR